MNFNVSTEINLNITETSKNLQEAGNSSFNPDEKIGNLFNNFGIFGMPVKFWINL